MRKTFLIASAIGGCLLGATYFGVRHWVDKSVREESVVTNRLRDRTESFFEKNRGVYVLSAYPAEDVTVCYAAPRSSCPEGYSHAFNVKTTDGKGNEETDVACVSDRCPVMVLNR